MSNNNNELLAKFFEFLTATPEKSEKVEEKVEEKQQEKVEEKVEEKQQEKAEEKQEEPKNHQQSPTEGNPAPETKEDNPALDGLKKQYAEAQNKIVESRVASKVAEFGIDSATMSSVSEFFDYAKLKDDKGEADDEKIDSLVSLLSSVALRKPPKHKDVLDDLSPKAQGIGKYLK